MRLNKIILFLAIAIFAVGCGQKEASEAMRPTEVKLPTIPATLTEPQQRADWLNIHFWDNMDWDDTSFSLDTAFMEQSFSNYTSVMSLANEDALNEGVSRLLNAAKKAPEGVYDYLMSIAEHYLYQADSPFLDEHLYRPFVEYALQRNQDDLRALSQLEDINRNAPGSIAPNFALMGRDGSRLQLYKHGDETATILMFYEPDCDSCKAAMKVLESSPRLGQAVSEGVIRIVVIYQGDDVDTWRNHAATLPQQWLVGIDSKNIIDDQELYLVRATPSFYLISPDNRVMLKDVSPSTLFSALNLD